MKKKYVNYIHCPECNGIIEMNQEQHLSSKSFFIPDSPRCVECGENYIIKVETSNTLKIIIQQDR